MRIIRYQFPATRVARSAIFNTWSGFENEIDRLVTSALGSVLNDGGHASALSHPRTDLYEDKESFHYRVELPGLKRDDIQVEVVDGVLTVSGARKAFGREGAAETSTSFTRSVSVPARVQEDKILARYEDGVLTVTLPKAEEVKPRRVAVQVK
jgi:HSP20 family protein